MSYGHTKPILFHALKQNVSPVETKVLMKEGIVMQSLLKKEYSSLALELQKVE